MLQIGPTKKEFVPSLFGCDQGATGKKEDVVKERKDGTLKKISAGVDKFLKELSKIGSRNGIICVYHTIAKRLSEFYEICRNDIGRGDRFIKIEQHSRHVNAGQEGVATDIQQRLRKPDVALSDT
ncbi:hypothetical protein Tco_1385240 [Tanacetum coccineum]